MRLLTGTQVLRLYPGCVQVGTDPGHEIVLSGLSVDQEEWLVECGQRSAPPPPMGRTSRETLAIPHNCAQIAQHLMDAGLAHHYSGDGLSVLVSRVEEPVLMGLEGALSTGSVSHCRVIDPRPSDRLSFTYARAGATDTPVDQWAMAYFEQLYPELPRPTCSSFDVEIRSVPLDQTFCEDPNLLSLPVPRLVVCVGQLSTHIGPILTSDGVVCPLCVSTWNAEQRHGVWPQSWAEHCYAPQLSFHMKLEAAQVIARFLSSYHQARLNGTDGLVRNLWAQRVVTVDSQGEVTSRAIAPHPDCQCQRNRDPLFAPHTSVVDPRGS